MAELKSKEEDEAEGLTAMENETASRKEKRKALKKAKRKGSRREVAEKERLEAEARRDDPAEQARMILAEQEEAERSLRERNEFEARERAWLAALEENQRRKAEEEEEEERRRKTLDDEASRNSQQLENENDDDGDWEYVEDGPPEIIWKGNEIILKKKRIKVPKKNGSEKSSTHEDKERPISNPFPPEYEASAEQKSFLVSGRDSVGNIAQQVPNFGTEQDKANCPFHLKTGVCRFGQRCSRVHFYPDKSCTLLMKNMYNGPGLAWEQDEGLEYTDEEVERCYEEFYEDVHTEFLKFGEILNFKVCRNGSFHLRGNVYVHFKSLDSAVLALQTVNGRYFAGKQVNCEFVNVSRWRIAICGEYMKTRYKNCSRGTACNFIHCFRNPGNDYEWADSDRPPPRYWVKNMIALFGFSDESAYERHTLEKNLDHLNSSDKIPSADVDQYRSRRSTSREKGYFHYKKEHARRSDQLRRSRNGEKDKNDNTLDENANEDGTNPKDSLQRKRRTHHGGGDSFDDERERSRDRCQDHGRKSSRWNCEDKEREFHDSRSYGSSKYQRLERLDDRGDCESEDRKAKRVRRRKGRDKEKDHESRKHTSTHSDRRGHKRRQKNADRDSDEWMDSEAAKHLRECSIEVLDPSDDEGELAKSSNSRGDCSRKETGKTDLFNKSLRSQWSNDPSEYDEGPRAYDLDQRRISGPEIAIVDRWEPGTHSSV